MNLQTAINNIPEGLDGVLVVSPENRFYFTGFPSSDGVLLLTKSGGFFFTDSRYLEAAQKQINECEVRNSEKLKESLKELCSGCGINVLGIESSHMTVREIKKYREMLSPVELSDLDDADNMISALREVKSRSELMLICQAQSVAEQALEHILGLIKPGVTEKDIQLELDYYMLKNGADALSFETIVVCGAKSSMPHGVPGLNRVKYGDFVTMDFGAVVDGYHSDMTRTVAVGRISDEQKKVYDTVLSAQLNALAVLKPGFPLKDADAAARDVIKADGFGSFFNHSTGHGVGVEIHEKPNLAPRSEGVLREGNVVTVEPGIYLPGEFGVRIEDMAYITADGCENLTKAPKDLVIL